MRFLIHHSGCRTLCSHFPRTNDIGFFVLLKVAYDLGSVYFYEADYYLALDMFSKVEKWSSQVEI